MTINEMNTETDSNNIPSLPTEFIELYKDALLEIEDYYDIVFPFHNVQDIEPDKFKTIEEVQQRLKLIHSSSPNLHYRVIKFTGIDVTKEIDIPKETSNISGLDINTSN